LDKDGPYPLPVLATHNIPPYHHADPRFQKNDKNFGFFQAVSGFLAAYGWFFLACGKAQQGQGGAFW